ncbi:MAG: class I SAM-dependent methyltransferase [Spirochaetes bacterium]|nr:MAG: class I SAM-dependent methyltransferase [Spirochaetota bacterium]
MKMRVILILVIILAAALGLFYFLGGRDWIESVSLNYTMETDSRLKKLKVDQVIRTLDLKPGQKVADIGAGTGLFTWPMARITAPQGIVYAVDINQFVLDDLGKKAAALKAGNVRVVKAQSDDPLIPEPVDLIFSCGTIHYIEDQAAYFTTLRKYLKPGGRIAIIDLQKSHPTVGHRIHYTPEEQDTWLARAGFTRTARYDFLEDFYFVEYQVKR